MNSLSEIRKHYAKVHKVDVNDIHIIKGSVKPSYTMGEVIKYDSSHAKGHKKVSVIVEKTGTGFKHKTYIKD